TASRGWAVRTDPRRPLQGCVHRHTAMNTHKGSEDENELLTTRPVSPSVRGTGTGVWLTTKRWLRRHGVTIMFLLFGLSLLIGLGSIDRGVRHIKISEAVTSFNFEALEPSLSEYKTDAFSILTSQVTSELLLLEFPTSTVMGVDPVLVLFSAIAASGTFDENRQLALNHYPAENTDRTVFQFRMAEDMKGIDLLRQQLTLRTTYEGMEEALNQGAPPEWIATLPVVGARQGKGGEEPSFVVSASTLFLNGFFITGMREPLLQGARVKLSDTRSFPLNADITIEYQTKPATPELTTVPLSLRFSISLLPADPMIPRVWDQRVGFFTTSFYDLGDHRDLDQSQRGSDLLDPQVTIINKQRLPAIDRLGGTGPLTYYVDPTVPEKWRATIKVGVENWQIAFEAAGHGPEAIRAVLPGDEDWPEDYDAADIRYNSITWAVDTGEVFAIGPSTIDPRSGEILCSNIIFTNGWMLAWTRNFEVLGETPAAPLTHREKRSLREDKSDLGVHFAPLSKDRVREWHTHQPAHGHGHGHMEHTHNYI
ncbi:unnamed protein product, partial [Choristocarpus tenellus]